MNLLKVAIIATHLAGAAIGVNAEETIIHVETEWDHLEEVRYIFTLGRVLREQNKV